MPEQEKKENINFVPLRIETISPDLPIDFNLYIFFKEQYLIYMTSGTSIDNSKLEKLKNQQVARFLIPENEQHLYQKYLAKLLAKRMNDKDSSTDEKINFIEAASSTAIEGMEQDPSTASSFTIAQNAAKGLRQIVADSPDALKKIFGKIVPESEQIIKHCMSVSALAGKVAQGAGLTDAEIDDLCTAALIHDIGLVKMPKNDRVLFNKFKKKYTTDDSRLYNFHIKSAEAMLKEKPWITKSVMDLICAHEEVLSGTGPLRKKKLMIQEEILSLCNCYDKRLITSGLTPKEVIKSMEIDELGNYNLKLIKHFKNVLITEGLV